MNGWIAGLLVIFVLYTALNEVRFYRLKKDFAEMIHLQKAYVEQVRSKK